MAETIEALGRQLREGSPEDGMRAAEALGETGDLRAVEQLVRALSHPHWVVVLRVAEALEKLGAPPAAAAALGQAFAHPQIHVRETLDPCLRRVAAGSGPEAIEALCALLLHSEPSVRKLAAETLGQRGAGAALDRLKARLPARTLFGRSAGAEADVEVRNAIQAAIARIQEVRKLLKGLPAAPASETPDLTGLPGAAGADAITPQGLPAALPEVRIGNP